MKMAREDPKKPGMLLVNAWNEYTEGSYLMPDAKNGDAYLRALKSALAVPLGGWHFVEVFIPVNPSERLCAKMRVTWPDGTVEEGESDYPHKPGTTDLNWTPIHDMSATDSRFFLDDLKVEYAL